MKQPRDPERQFWRDAVALKGAVTRQISFRLLVFGLVGLGVYVLDVVTGPDVKIGIEVAPYEVAGAALGLLLVLRTNAGYDRWWEGRRMWGAITNQSRSLAVAIVANGPDDPEWREQAVRWVAAFAHVARCSLRGERALPAVVALLGEEEAGRITAAPHMPSYVALRIARVLRDGRDRLGLDPYAFLGMDRDRALLIDHYGCCERIRTTPLPRVYSINIRRFIVAFLLVLPFALLHKLSDEWMIPFVMIVVAYPILALDEIGVELQNPFDVRNLGHLPLDEICATIERNLLGLLPEALVDH